VTQNSRKAGRPTGLRARGKKGGGEKIEKKLSLAWPLTEKDGASNPAVGDAKPLQLIIDVNITSKGKPKKHERRDTTLVTLKNSSTRGKGWRSRLNLAHYCHRREKVGRRDIGQSCAIGKPTTTTIIFFITGQKTKGDGVTRGRVQQIRTKNQTEGSKGGTAKEQMCNCLE